MSNTQILPHWLEHLTAILTAIQVGVTTIIDRLPAPEDWPWDGTRKHYTFLLKVMNGLSYRRPDLRSEKSKIVSNASTPPNADIHILGDKTHE